MVDRPKRPEGAYPTLTVRRSWTAQTAEGAIALVMDTQERGPIAFVVTLETIPLLRNELARAEMALLRTPGTA
jgi:hypothetical protein